MKKKIFGICIVTGVISLFSFGIMDKTVMAATKGPIKIGFMAPYVGVFTQLGTDMDKGFRLCLEEIEYRMGGREVKFITADTEGKPPLGPTKVKQLVEKDRVHILAGIVHSGLAYSIRDYVHEHKIPLIITNAGGQKLTSELKSPYIFRVSFANGQQDLAGGWYAYHTLGHRKMMTLAMDTSSGYDKTNGFKKYFTGSGGIIVEEMYHAIGTPDFSPLLGKILKRAKQIDGLWVFSSGSDTVRFIKQYDEYGLKKMVPLFVIGDTVDDTVLPAMGESSLGIKNYSHYSPTLDTPENKRFVAAYRKKYGETPGCFSEQGYVGTQVLAKAIAKVKGNIEDTDSFLKALGAVELTAPRGPFSFDENNNVIENVYIRIVEKVEGKPLNIVVDSIPHVGQFWSPPK